MDIRGEVIVGSDVMIDVDVILEGKVVLGDGVTVGPSLVYLFWLTQSERWSHF